MADVALWLYGQLVKGKQLPRDCARLMFFILQNGWRNDFSFAGVDRAIRIVEMALEKWGAPVFVRHEIVHNRFVVDGLRAKGAVFVEELDECPTDRPVIFSAHGVPKAVPAEAERRQMIAEEDEQRHLGLAAERVDLVAVPGAPGDADLVDVEAPLDLTIHGDFTWWLAPEDAASPSAVSVT